MKYSYYHQGLLKTSWNTIKELKVIIVEYTNENWGKIIWKVVEKVTEDELEEVREREEDLFNHKKINIDKIKIEDEEWNYNKLF